MPSEQPMVNLLTPEAREDPYPLYEVLRETAPVFYAPLGFWVVSRHRDVLSVLRDPPLLRRPHPDGRPARAGWREPGRGGRA